MTNAERHHRNRVAGLDCIVCLNNGLHSSAELHHVRRLATSKKRDTAPIIGLCYQHHRGPWGIGIHSGRKTWEILYGKELDLLAQVEILLKGE